MRNKTTDELAKILWDFNNLGQRVARSDVIICFGSHDTRTAERGAELFLQSMAPLVVMSGGLGRLTDTTWKKTEAEVFSEVAVKVGVPKDKILLEDKSTNTAENVEYSIKLLKKKGVKYESAILVHKPYMERRAYLTWKLRSNTSAVVTSPQYSFDKFMINSPVTKDENIAIVVGDTQRIKVYAERGFIQKHKIPNEVWTAYEELVKRGFTQHLVKD